MAIGTTNFPTSIDTVVELVEAANKAADILNGGIDSSVTSLTLNDASRFASSGIVIIDDEYIAYGSRTSTSLQSLVRGFEGSTAASHSNGAPVRQIITAASNNVKSAAIIAIETKLGTGTDIAWGQMAPLTANRLAVSDGSGDISASGVTHDATNLIVANVGAIDFDDSPTVTAGAASLGRLTWNDGEGTLNLTLKGGNVTVPLSQRDTTRVVNVSGTNFIGSNYQAVRISTPQGQRIGVVPAQANNEANSTDILGIVSENINDNNTGFVTTRGIISGINTSGSIQGETWADGDVLYLSPSTAGALTNAKPSAPNHLVIIGYVVYAHGSEGKIFVAIQTSWETSELHDVKITGTPAAGQLLIRNATTGVWENANLTAGTAISITNADKSITINSTATGDVTGPSSSTSTAIARFNGTSGKTIQDSSVTIDSSGGLTFPTNVRQTFNPGSTTPGFNVGSVSSDPSSLNNGDIWYRTDAVTASNRQFRVRRNGATESLATVPLTATSDREIPTINPSTGNLDNVSEMFYIAADNALKLGDIGTGRIQLSAITTETPTISSIGADTNISLNLVPKGTGTVQANGVSVATISGSQTLTNKTINGSNNTISNVSLSSAVTGTLPIANGGTGATTAQSAINALVGSVASGNYLRGNGTNVVMSLVQAADITGTLAVANGGTGVTTSTGSGSNVLSTSPTITTPTFSGAITPDTTNASSAGFLGIPVNTQSSTGTYNIVIGDSGKTIYLTSTTAATFTAQIPANGSVAFPVGTAITFMHDGGASTVYSIAITTDTLQLAGSGTTGTRTLARYGVATAVKVTSTKWIISGTGLS